MKVIIVSLIFLGLIGCSNGNSSNSPRSAPEVPDVPEEDVVVYISKENTQCNNDGLSTDESIQALVSAGIDVLDTFCGVKTGWAYTAACGSDTGDIIAHEIRDANFTDAREIGYESIEALVDVENMLGYEIKECESITAPQYVCEQPLDVVGRDDGIGYVIGTIDGVNASLYAAELIEMYQDKVNILSASYTFFAAELSEQALRMVRCDARIRYIEYDGFFSTT